MSQRTWVVIVQLRFHEVLLSRAKEKPLEFF